MMIEIRGKHNVAKLFSDEIEEGTRLQIIKMLDQEWLKESKVRIMPDCHKGAGCTIGTTMTIEDKIVPNLVGVDIGCGMLAVNLNRKSIDFNVLDNFIRKHIPHGFNINKKAKADYIDEILSLKCVGGLPKSAVEYNKALGSLGSGNHFIEVNKDSKDNLYLVVHSGSRNLGLQVATYYQNLAIKYHNKKLKAGKSAEIPKDLCYLEGDLKNDYLHDMKIIQQYAYVNREVMAKRIVKECLEMNFNELTRFQTIHNYIDIEKNILRKGAVSAEKDELLLIPINMRDGSLLCRGKGNPDWNYSAPHGAGRIMSRTAAKKTFQLKEFQKSMKGIFTTCVSKNTLDECPMTYKPIEEIVKHIGETVDIIDRLIPVYNFKA